MNVLLTPQNIKIVASASGFMSKKKERFDIILEPLQAILQLALISFCPTGTKLNIQNNLLLLQQPSYSQGLVRWYQNDNREDLFYLFYICKRFPKFYQHLKDIKSKKHNLYDLLIKLAHRGIDNLSQTYSKAEQVSLLHTLEMYKMLLDNPASFEFTDKVKHDKSKAQEEINNIFIKITSIYSTEEYHIILNTLIRLIKDDENSESYINGLNSILEPTTGKINKWILNNIVF
jgi:hypothetical protein